MQSLIGRRGFACPHRRKRSILAESAPDQRDREINLQRGDFFWQDANATRALRNIGDSRIELVELELK